jgi:hypothetical protein
MWSSWVKRKGTTQVMYIAKLKGGPKRVKKTFSMISERVFWSWSVFLLSKCWLPLLFDETLGAFIFPSLAFLYICSVSWGLRGFDDIWGENHFFKNFFSNGLKWNVMAMTGYTDGGRIFPNGVMHANMAKPWLWRWRSCGYIGGGRTFRSGGVIPSSKKQNQSLYTCAQDV